MKTHAKIATGISTILLIAGTVFKIEHWPHASEILFIAFAIFIFWVLPSVTITLRKNTADNKSQTILWLIPSFLFLQSLGILFKILHWPGANLFLAIGAFVFIILLAPLYLLRGLKKLSISHQKLFITFIVVGCTLLLTVDIFKMLLWGTTIISWLSLAGILSVLAGLYFYQKHPDLSRLKLLKQETNLKYFFINILAILFVIINLRGESTTMAEIDLIKRNIDQDVRNVHESISSDIKESRGEMRDTLLKVQQLSDDVIQYIDNLALNLVYEVSREKKSGFDSLEISSIRKADNFDIPVSVLIGNDPSHPKPGAYTANELKNKLMVFKMHLLSFVEQRDKARLEKRTGLHTNERVVNNTSGSWETDNFYHVPLRTILLTLTQYKLKVRMAERSTVDYLLNN